MTNLEKLREKIRAAEVYNWPSTALGLDFARTLLAELEAGEKLREAVIKLQHSGPSLKFDFDKSFGELMSALGAPVEGRDAE